MKRIVLRTLIVLVAGSLAMFAAQAGTAPEETQEQQLPEGQDRVVVKVEGMSCGSCCVAVETAVRELAGVVAAKADYQKGRATITYETDTVTVQKIVETINDNTSFKASVPEEKDS